MLPSKKLKISAINGNIETGNAIKITADKCEVLLGEETEWD